MDKEKITIIGGHKFFVRGDGSSGIVPNDEVKVRKMYSEELLDEYYRLRDGLKNIKQYIKTKIGNSALCDWGISDKLSDRLFTETVVELQIIEQMIDEILEGK